MKVMIQLGHGSPRWFLSQRALWIDAKLLESAFQEPSDRLRVIVPTVYPSMPEQPQAPRIQSNQTANFRSLKIDREKHLAALEAASDLRTRMDLETVARYWNQAGLLAGHRR